MFKREKRYLYLNNSETDILLKSLVRLKNALIRDDRYTDCVDELILKITGARVERTYRDDNSSLCLVLPYATAEYLNNRESFESYYDSIEISQEAANAHPKAAIQIRNREMVNRADLIICYIEHQEGGAYQTVKYAKQQCREIINMAPDCSGHLLHQ